MSGMLDVAQQTDKPGDYKGQIFIGKVVVNDDPRHFHRIKAEIPDMWDQYKVEELPWCLPGALPGVCGPGNTAQCIPETGSFVYIEFQNGDNHFPVYLGGVRDYRTYKGKLEVNYPHRVGWRHNSFKELHSGTERKRKHEAKTPPAPYPVAGHEFYLDRSTNDVEYEHPTLTRIHIYDNGSVYLEARSKRWPDGGDLRFDTDRDFRLNVGLATSPGRPGDMYVDVVEGKLDVHVKTTANIVVEGNTTVTCGANLTATVAGNASATVQGTTSVTSVGPMSLTSPLSITLQAATIQVLGNVLIAGTIGYTGTGGGSGNVSLRGNINHTGDTVHQGNTAQQGNIALDGNLASTGTVSDSDATDTA